MYYYWCRPWCRLRAHILYLLLGPTVFCRVAYGSTASRCRGQVHNTSRHLRRGACDAEMLWLYRFYYCASAVSLCACILQFDAEYPRVVGDVFSSHNWPFCFVQKLSVQNIHLRQNTGKVSLSTHMFRFGSGGDKAPLFCCTKFHVVTLVATRTGEIHRRYLYLDMHTVQYNGVTSVPSPPDVNGLFSVVCTLCRLGYLRLQTDISNETTPNTLQEQRKQSAHSLCTYIHQQPDLNFRKWSQRWSS